MNILNFKNVNILSIALAFVLLVPNVQANEFGISDLEYQEIESRVNSMSFSELNARRAFDVGGFCRYNLGHNARTGLRQSACTLATELVELGLNSTYMYM